MSNALAIAKPLFLNSNALDEQGLMRVLALLGGGKLDDGDLYFQRAESESWYLEDGEVKSGSFSLEEGVGIRVVSGEKTGFAYSEELDYEKLANAARAARSITAQHTGGLVPKAQSRTRATAHYKPINPLLGFSKQQKIDLLRSVDAEARRQDPRVEQVTASLSASYEVVMIAGIDGQLHADVRPLVSIHVNVTVVDKKGRRETARSGGGGRFALSWYLEEERAKAFAREAVREALVNLEAVPAPAGMMPVVLGSGWPGVLLHEAVGHGLEGDFNRKGLSAFSGRIGERVAAAGVTVVDDGTLPDRRGSLSVDDEGTPSQCTTLIEDGVLVGYMQDRLNARLMGMQSTGNCRRESYAHMPMPRMTNTYMRNGQYCPEEIIASVEKGIYAVNFGGGQVDITSGQFVFSASEAYLIENGKVTRPIKGATLIGNGSEVMQAISMIGNDLKLDPGIGVCGKDGQSVPVGVGQPTLKIAQLTVGGTESSF